MRSRCRPDDPPRRPVAARGALRRRRPGQAGPPDRDRIDPAAFGVAPLRRRPIALALPAVELAVAAALLPAASAPYAGVAAALLLALFSFEVARVLAAGEQVDCNCFGSLGVDRITRWTLVRNVAFLIPALIVATAGWGDPGPSAVAWVGDLGSTAVAAALAGVALVVAALAFALAWQVMRQNGRLLERLEAFEDGTPTAASRAGAAEAGRRAGPRLLPAGPRRRHGVPGRPARPDRGTGAHLQRSRLPRLQPAAAGHRSPAARRRRAAAGGDEPRRRGGEPGEGGRARTRPGAAAGGLRARPRPRHLRHAGRRPGRPEGRIAAEPVEDSDRVAELLTELLPAVAPDAPDSAAPLEVVRAGGAL